VRPEAHRKLLRVIVAMGASLTGASCGSRTPLDDRLLASAGAPGAAASDDAAGVGIGADGGGATGSGAEASAIGPSQASPGGPAVTGNAVDAATLPTSTHPAASVDSGNDVVAAVSTDGAAGVDGCPVNSCCFQYSPTCVCLVVCIM
jgi:hypothetical protein